MYTYRYSLSVYMHACTHAYLRFYTYREMCWQATDMAFPPSKQASFEAPPGSQVMFSRSPNGSKAGNGWGCIWL